MALSFHFHLWLQEGANINKSLTTLGKVISALAEVVSVYVYLYLSFLSSSSFSVFFLTIYNLTLSSQGIHVCSQACCNVCPSVFSSLVLVMPAYTG